MVYLLSFLFLALLELSRQDSLEGATTCMERQSADVNNVQLSLNCTDSEYFVSYNIDPNSRLVSEVNIYVICGDYCISIPIPEPAPSSYAYNNSLTTFGNNVTTCEVIGCFTLFGLFSGYKHFKFRDIPPMCMIGPEPTTVDTTTPMENETSPTDATTPMDGETSTVHATTPTENETSMDGETSTVDATTDETKTQDNEILPVESMPPLGVTVIASIIAAILVLGIVVVIPSIILWKARGTRVRHSKLKYFEPLEPFEDDPYLPPISISEQCMKSASESQLSIYHPLYHPATDVEVQKSETYISQSSISPLQSFPKEDLKVYYTMSGSSDGQNNYHHLDSLSTPSYSQSSLYEDCQLSPSNSERTDQNYVETACFNYPADTDTDYIESTKIANDNMAMHQKPKAKKYFHLDADSNKHISEKETIDLIQALPLEKNSRTDFNACFKDGSEASRETTTEFDRSQDTDGVVFEFGDGSDSSSKEPSFEIDPKSLTLSSDYFSRGLDYILTHEDQRYDNGISNIYGYVPAADKHSNTSHIKYGFLDLRADTPDYSDDIIFDDYRHTSVLFPHMKYFHHGRATQYASTSSSYISSGTSMNSGYISSETSLYGDSGIGARVHFIPTSPCEVDISFLEEIPIYNLTN